MSSDKPMRRHRSIRTKITFWFSGFFLLLLAAVLVSLFFLSQSTLQTDTRDRLVDTVTADLEELEYISAGERDDDEGDHYIKFRDAYLEIDDDFISRSDGMLIALYDGDELVHGSSLLEESGDEQLECQDQELRKVTSGGQEYYVYDAKVTEDGLEGLWLRGTVSTQSGETALLAVARLMVLVIPFLALLVILGGYALASRVLRPLQEMSDQAETISTGQDLSRRIQIRGESAETARLRDTFNRMLERLQSSFEAEKRFTSDASHELRTPIAVISAECEYALGEEDPAEWRESLDVVQKQSAKMQGLVEELLTFTRMEQRTVPLSSSQLALSSLAEATAKDVAAASEMDISLHTDLEPGAVIWGDENLVRILLRNLIENAFRYGKEGGNVWLSVVEGDKFVSLTVRDDGIGIRQEELPKIWNRFYRCDDARTRRDSTGLGLSIAREILQLHNANAQVESVYGEGTTITVNFQKSSFEF